MAIDRAAGESAYARTDDRSRTTISPARNAIAEKAARDRSDDRTARAFVAAIIAASTIILGAIIGVAVSPTDIHWRRSFVAASITKPVFIIAIVPAAIVVAALVTTTAVISTIVTAAIIIPATIIALVVTAGCVTVTVTAILRLCGSGDESYDCSQCRYDNMKARLDHHHSPRTDDWRLAVVNIR